MELSILKKEMLECRVCDSFLPLGPRPVFRLHEASRVLIVGQAPGMKVHESGIPWDDASGIRLRSWLGVSEKVFYDSELISIIPMGLCYPGSNGRGDLPPRPECAPIWHPVVLDHLKQVELTIYLGAYSFQNYLSNEFASLTDAIKGFQRLLPTRLMLPHPSPRNRFWLQSNPWFERDVLPPLRDIIARLGELEA